MKQANVNLLSTAVNALFNTCLATLLLVAVSTCGAQTPPNTSTRPPEYIIGPGDRILVEVMDAEELQDLTGKELQVGNDGYLNVPTVGRIYASGLSTEDLQTALTASLKRYVKNPRVFVNVISIKSQTVSVLGSVRNPGVQPLDGPKTLAQVLANAGGLAQDAGYQVKITRESRWGKIPLENAQVDHSTLFSTAEIRSRDLTDGKNPTENILVRPNDVITVPKSQLVYVIGEVKRPGGYTLGEHSTIPVLQALALAEGLTTTASPSKARVLRYMPGSNTRTETTVDLKKLSNAKAVELDLRADDILIVPNNSARRVGVKVLETALATVSGIVIFRGI